MTSVHRTSTGDSVKPLMSHNDTDINSVYCNDDTRVYVETGMTPTSLKEDTVKICIDDKNHSTGSGHIRSSRVTGPFAIFHFKLERFLADHWSVIKKIALSILAFGYLGYFVYALYLHVLKQCDLDVWPLVAVTWTALFIVLVRYILSKFGDDVTKYFNLVHGAMMSRWFILRWVAMVLIYGGMLAIIVVTVWDVPRNLVSLAGIITFIIILFICSANPTQVKWQPVLGGITLQFYIAFLILRWDIGYRSFRVLGQKIQTFLSYSDVGATFVFGNKYVDHIFAMKVLPVIIFFSCFISILYHLGIMQVVIGSIAWVMRAMLGTTAAESLSAASNIFVGMMEAAILIRPFLPLMTKSELHAVMVGGFATIAGGVMAAYISFGVPAEHLLCASVMSAPCALAVSKLLYPEVEHSKLKNMSDIEVCDENSSKPRNVIEAAAAGASASIGLIANIAANLIALLAILAFVNGALSWFGSFVCYDGLTFEKLCSYAFMPIAYLMGVDWADAGVVGELLGIKTFLNEFIAYKELSKYIANRQECAFGKPMISQRSEIIATYALCGFSNLGSIGIELGGLGPMAPKRVADLVQLVIRALFGGIVTCLLTACVAGLLMEDDTGAMMSCVAKDVNATSSMDTTINSTVLNTTLLYM